MLPTTPSQNYTPPNQWVTLPPAVSAPPLPPKPKKSERPVRHPNASPPPPLPPRQPRLPPRATPTRGVLESRSPHMDPVDPRREHNLMMQQMNSHSNPLPLGPRRHSNVVNGSGHRYPPPPLSLRPGSEGTSPSFSPDPRPPPHSASARVQHGQFDLNNSLGTISKTPSSSTSGGGGGSHFTFTEATPPPRPPPHRPMNSVSQHD